MNALEVTELHTGKRGKRHFVLCAHLHAEEQTGRPAVLRAMCHRAGHALALNSREHRQSHLVVMDQLLLYHLHGIDLVVLLQPYQQDLGVAPAPNDPDQVEVLQPEPLRYLDPVHPVDDWLEVLMGWTRWEEAGGDSSPMASPPRSRPLELLMEAAEIQEPSPVRWPLCEPGGMLRASLP